MKGFKFKNRIVTDYVSALLLLFIVLFIVSVCFLGYSVRFSNAQNERNSLLQLKRTQEQVDRSLLFLSKTAMRIAQNNRLLELEGYDSKNSTDVYGAATLARDLMKELNGYDFCEGFYVYIRAADVILYNGYVYAPQDFFQFYVNDGQYETWKRKLSEVYNDACYADYAALNQTTVNGTFEYRLSYPFGGESRGTIVFIVSKGIFVQNNVSAEKQKNAVCMYAFNQKQELVYQTADESAEVLQSYLTMPDGYSYTKGLHKVMVCRTTSERGNIRYFYVDKGSRALSTARRISLFLFLYVVLGLCGGSIYIYLVTQKVVQRSKRMYAFLNNEATADTTLDWNMVMDGLEDLSRQNSRLDRLMSVKNDMDINRHFINLLHDYSEYAEQSKRALEELGVRLDVSDYMLVLGTIHISQEEKPDLVKYAMQNILKDLMGSRVQWYFIDYNWNRVMFLITGNFHEDFQRDTIEIFGMLAEFIRSILDIGVHFDFGTVCHSIEEIRLTVRQMLDYYEYDAYAESSEHTERDNQPGGVLQYGYLQAQENELVSLVLAGSQEEAVEYLQKLFAVHKNAGSSAMRILIFNLLGTLFKCAEKICGIDAMQEMDLSVILYSQDVQEVEAAVTDHFKRLSERVSHTEERRHLKALGLKLMQYVDVNFHNPDLSLKTLSAEFGITVSYASKIFKEQIGSNFSDYLTAKRIEKAKQLLESTDLSITEIAQKTGYVDSSTFIKNFKKVTRVTPGTYRGKR